MSTNRSQLDNLEKKNILQSIMNAKNTQKSSAPSRFYRRWWFWLISGILVLFTSLLILIPYGIDYGIVYWLRSEGADQARISNIDFNPFTRALKLYGLDVTTADNRVLKIDQATLLFAWSPFLKRRLHVTEMGITGLDLTIEQLPEHRWRIGGIAASLLSDQESETFPWGYQLNQLQINNGRIQFLTPKANVSLTINNTRLSRVISWQPEQIARFDFLGRLNGSELRVEADVSPFAVKPKVNGKLKLTDLDLAPFARLATPHLGMLAGRLNLNVVVEGLQTNETDFRLTQKGRMSLEQLLFKKENVEISESQLIWNGSLTVQQSESGSQQQVAAEGQIEGSRLDMALPSSNLQLGHTGLFWKGKFNFTQNKTNTHINTDSEIDLNDLHLKTAEWNVAEKNLSWKGAFLLAVALKPENFRLSSSGLLKSDQLVMNLPTKNLSLKYGAQFWEGKVEARHQLDQWQIDWNRKLILDDILIETPEFTFAQKQAVWEGDVQMSIPAKPQAAQISSTGRVSGDGLELSFIQTNMTVKQDGLSWEGSANYRQNASASEIIIDSKTSVPNITVTSPQAGIAKEFLEWDGIVRVSIPQKADGLHIHTEGRLNGGPFKMSRPDQNMILDYSGFAWDGKLGYDRAGGDTAMAADGKFGMNDVQINHAKQNLNLLELKQLTLDGIKMESLQQLNVSKAEIKELNLLKPSESKKTTDEGAALFSVSGASFEKVAFSPANDLGMDAAIFENAVLYLHHTSAGQWVYISDLTNILAADGSAESNPQAQPISSAKPGVGAKAESKKFGFRIDNLKFAGDSAVRFVDETVNPTYSVKLNFMQAVVSDLDNRRPEQPSPLKLAAAVGKYSRVNLQGNIQPFTDRFSMEVRGNIEAFDLPPLSPYTVKSIGYNLVSGELDADVDLKVLRGKLKGQSDFRVSRLELKAAEKKPEAGPGQSAGLKMPLESTLRLLRDAKNNIELKVPITGDITDPEFSFSNAINQAVVRALSMASLSYLKYALGPYGMAIGVAELAIKAVPGIRLQSVGFEPGGSDLNEDAAAYLQQVATIMRDRPGLKVAICGLATEKDRSFLSNQDQNQGADVSSIDNKLLELAQKRAESIEDHLVNQYEIKNERIFICKPELDRDAEGEPRAELLV